MHGATGSKSGGGDGGEGAEAGGGQGPVVGIKWGTSARTRFGGGEVAFVQWPCRLGRQLRHGVPALTQEQFLQRPVLLHLQHTISTRHEKIQ